MKKPRRQGAVNNFEILRLRKFRRKASRAVGREQQVTMRALRTQQRVEEVAPQRTYAAVLMLKDRGRINSDTHLRKPNPFKISPLGMGENPAGNQEACALLPVRQSPPPPAFILQNVSLPGRAN